jgi:Lon protease-like protein
MTDKFNATFATLPDTLPIFPLSGAVLLPRQLLPLNIFEPRYLEMIFAALRADRHIGMIQPQPMRGAEKKVALQAIGCAGRVSAFQEADDGRLHVQLTGVCRFAVAEELEVISAYRRIRPNWAPFKHDIGTQADVPVDFDSFSASLKLFAQAKQLDVPWEQIDEIDGAVLVDLIATQFPFSDAEKQTFLEAPTQTERVAALKNALELGALSQVQSESDDTPTPTQH